MIFGDRTVEYDVKGAGGGEEATLSYELYCYLGVLSDDQTKRFAEMSRPVLESKLLRKISLS